MPIRPIVSEAEHLRRAIAWLARQGPWTAELIGEACQRFDLSPIDEEFLLREWRRMRRGKER
jgi:hypothetical protein